MIFEPERGFGFRPILYHERGTDVFLLFRKGIPSSKAVDFILPIVRVNRKLYYGDQIEVSGIEGVFSDFF